MYQIFCGETHYPNGGMRDYQGTYKELPLKAVLDLIADGSDWCQIVLIGPDYVPVSRWNFQTRVEGYTQYDWTGEGWKQNLFSQLFEGE